MQDTIACRILMACIHFHHLYVRRPFTTEPDNENYSVDWNFVIGPEILHERYL